VPQNIEISVTISRYDQKEVPSTHQDRGHHLVMLNPSEQALRRFLIFPSKHEIATVTPTGSDLEAGTTVAQKTTNQG
jgi:hypothetical protein